MAKLNSVIASVPVFFDEDENLDYSSLEKYLNIVTQENHTELLYLMAYNSRINLLSNKEVIELNHWISDFAKNNNLMYTLCPPYKATNRTVSEFLENFDNNDLLYGVSLLFPERIYDDFNIVSQYFSIPKSFGMKTLMHEMKYVSGKDGSLTDWTIEALQELQGTGSIIGIKEDSKNDKLTKQCYDKLSLDLIIAGGGLSQVAALENCKPKTWLAGVSLIRPDLATSEHSALVMERRHHIDYFCQKIERPFFELCKKYGWHCVHKYLINSVHGTSPYERQPMSTLDQDGQNIVNKVWFELITPQIDSFIEGNVK